MCPVCSAEPFQACIAAFGGIDPEPHQAELAFGDSAGEVGWAEYQVLSALRTLRELVPDHPYVKAAQSIIEDQGQQPLDHPQAD